MPKQIPKNALLGNKKFSNWLFYLIIGLFTILVIKAFLVPDFSFKKTKHVISIPSIQVIDDFMKDNLDLRNSLVSDDEKEHSRIIYSIMSGDEPGPKFITAIIDPQDVAVGDTQYLEVVVKDEVGVENVVAETDLDNGVKKILKLELIAGDKYQGTWATSWIVHDTHTITYETKFTATNINGETDEVRFGWKDSCTPPMGVNGRGWTLNTDQGCNNGGIIGVDGGNLVVNATLRLDPNTLSNENTYLYFNEGQSIVMSGGSILIGKDEAKGIGGVIGKAYIYAKDLDLDGQYATLELVTSSDPGTIQYATDDLWNSVGDIRYINPSGFEMYTRVADLGKLTDHWASQPVWPSGYVTRPTGGDCRENYLFGADSSKYFSGQPLYFNPDISSPISGDLDYDCSGSVETYTYDEIVVSSVCITMGSCEPKIVGGQVYSCGAPGEGCAFEYSGGNVTCWELAGGCGVGASHAPENWGASTNMSH